MDSDFEKKLSRLPAQKIPGAWRDEILAAAREAQPSPHTSRITHHTPRSTLIARLSTIFWPHPRAWAALATAWVLIFVLNFSTRDTSSAIARNLSPPSPEAVAELKKQQRLFAELVGGHETAEADRSKNFPPKPHTGRAEILAV